MPDSAQYTVGRGKPPQHTRFQKGRSGNPGGKPGPEKALRTQLRDAVGKTLGTRMEKLKSAKRRTALEELADRLVLYAIGGNAAQARLLFSLLEEEEKRDDGRRTARKRLRLFPSVRESLRENFPAPSRRA